MRKLLFSISENGHLALITLFILDDFSFYDFVARVPFREREENIDWHYYKVHTILHIFSPQAVHVFDQFGVINEFHFLFLLDLERSLLLRVIETNIMTPSIKKGLFNDIISLFFLQMIKDISL